MNLLYQYDNENIDYTELSNLYKIAPLGNKEPNNLKIVFSNSMYKCFVYDEKRLIGAGRALADGVDCSYICDVVIHPNYQGKGIGKEIISKLVRFSQEHKKIILYANIGKEGFYSKLGFCKMNTAMAIFQDKDRALQSGLISDIKDSHE